MAVASPSTDALDAGPIVITFDGSVRGADHHNDPSAAVGYTIERMGEPIVEESARLAYWRSNTHVEYDALIAALEHALELGFTGHVSVLGDAESVLEVVAPDGDATPNDRLTRRYAEAVRDLLDEFESASLKHVKRHHNETADALASDGHERRELVRM